MLKELDLKRSKMIKVVFCGYRSWAKEIIEKISVNENIICVDKVYSLEEYNSRVCSWGEDIDFILFLGWSWIIPKEITEKHLCLGIHPSDLPNYRGGSPIQHQIINGVLNSKVTLMTLSSTKLDGGEIWMKENLNLIGNNMDQVFDNIIKSSIKLLTKFIENYQSITPSAPDLQKGSYFKRRKPEESKILLKDFNTMKLEEIYNFIRALTDPYPNAYIEDENGNRMYFNEVVYVEKNKS